MPRRLWRLAPIPLILSVTSVLAAAEPMSAEGLRFFEKRVRPLLAEQCWDCHDDDDAEGGLRLDSLSGILRGGTRGPAIVVGRPEQSLLVRALRHSERLQMPPKEKLPTRDIADIIKWIQMGAPWPAATVTAATSKKDAAKYSSPETDQIERHFSEEEKAFWAFQPPIAAPQPRVHRQDWVTSPIDAFIMRKMAAQNLEPAPPADKTTLIRRATFDLTGLPPTPAEIEAFLADGSAAAFARVVERLLNSPHYGERWGRRWLDVARYADSNGLDENLAYANAFRYRDYVVAAFNSDKPYDRFIQEQLAGDLLCGDQRQDEAALDALVATGFLSLGAKMLAEDDPVKMQMDIIDEQIDTVGRTFMGLTLGCARCHDHKFDPIPTADYYSLAGIFKSTRTMENFKVVARWQERTLALPAARKRQQEHQRRVAENQVKIDRLTEQARKAILADAEQHVGDYLLAAVTRQRRRDLLSKATVFGNQPAAASAAGAVLLEAEDFARGNVLKDHTNYGKAIGVLVNQGELPNYVEYDLDLLADGWYQVELRYAAEVARPCRLTVNGELVTSTAAGGTTGGWFPDSQRWQVEGFYEFPKGKNVLRLEHPQHFPHIDKVLLAPNSAAAEVPSWEPLSPDYKPIPEFVEAWSHYLVRSQEASLPLFSAWHACLSGSGIESLQGHAADVGDALFENFGCHHGSSVRAIAERYQERFSRAARLAESTRDSADDEFHRVLDDPNGPFANVPELESYYPAALVAELAKLRDEKRALEEVTPALPEAMAVSDEAKPQDVRIHIRGSHLTQGDEVPRRFPQILAGEDQPPLADDRSGRLELAQWLTNPHHPLTARVMVNRIWQGHFGTGLVRSPDNFGRLGERPTHPALLDWLAVQFVESGWSIKSMHRLMMLSSTYQMSSVTNPRPSKSIPRIVGTRG